MRKRYDCISKKMLLYLAIPGEVAKTIPKEKRNLRLTLHTMFFIRDNLVEIPLHQVLERLATCFAM